MSNKQFMFLQHIYRSLEMQGRTAVILPDNVLFESRQGKQITIWSTVLPSGACPSSSALPSIRASAEVAPASVA